MRLTQWIKLDRGTFYDDVTVLAESRTLHGERRGSPGIGLGIDWAIGEQEAVTVRDIKIGPAQRSDCGIRRRT